MCWDSKTQDDPANQEWATTPAKAAAGSPMDSTLMEEKFCIVVGLDNAAEGPLLWS
jgi:hypothetical protein